MFEVIILNLGEKMGLGYNKLISYEDFSNPALKEFIREIYFANPGESTIHPPEKNKKHWEVAMSLRAMKDFGKLNRDSRVLGVGAGAEQTSFYLTNFVKSEIGRASCRERVYCEV